MAPPMTLPEFRIADQIPVGNESVSKRFTDIDDRVVTYQGNVLAHVDEGRIA
jgi:hypothetical protein